MIRVIQEGQKSGGLWGYLLNFPLKNGLPLKIEILQYLDLGLLLEAEILLKYVLLYILQIRGDILQTEIKEIRL